MAKNNGVLGMVAAAIVAAAAGYGAVYVSMPPERNDGPARAANASLPADDAADETAGRSTDAVTENASKSGEALLAGLNRGELAAFLVHKTPKTIPAIRFNDASGAKRELSDWRGKVVLVNLWATWCAPCRKEMPDLDTLKADLAGPDFDVVAISLDRGDISKPRDFLKKVEADTLELFHDPSGKLGSELRAIGMPTTLLIDREGREIGRLVGPAKWDGTDARRLVKAAVAGSGGAGDQQTAGTDG